MSRQVHACSSLFPTFYIAAISIQRQGVKIISSLIRSVEAEVSGWSQSQKAIRASQGHKSPGVAALTSFVSALTVSYSGLVVEGWATATGSRTKESSPSARVSRVKWHVAGVNSSQ